MLDRTDAEGALGAQDTGRDGCRSDCVGCVATEQRRGEHVVVITSSQAGAARFSRRARAGVAVVLLAAIGATGCGGTAAREATRLDSSRQPAHGAQNTQASVATSDDIADGSAIAASVVRTQLDALMRQYDAATNALLARLWRCSLRGVHSHRERWRHGLVKVCRGTPTSAVRVTNW